MNTKYLDKLEYNKILDKLSSFARTYIGKEMVAKLTPSFNYDEVSHLQLQTSQAVSLIYKYGTPPITDFSDISMHIKKLNSSSSLSAKELLDIANILKMSHEIQSYFTNITENLDANDFNAISSFFKNLYVNSGIEKSILNKIVDEFTLEDNASTTLASIRRSKRSLENNIKDKLNHFIHSSKYSKYLMDPIITIRDNRFVIPVKDEYRSQISGFVHDISSSGSTVFIEPTSIFDMNNEINTLKIKENIEIERILLELSSMLFPYVNELLNNIRLLGIIDFIFAKASYSISIDGMEPSIHKEKYFELKDARHPLIDKTSVVPTTVPLGKDYSCLVVTGPNTGGKTVTLKTVGLILLMAYSGLQIPAHENSSICVFDNIFADIGDEQSIQESLSTFSSHMVNIIDIIKNSTTNSLILLDELGSGTDPVEGSSLAISILEYFHTIDSLCISTTHYPEIKNYALTHEGYMNSSVEFDVDNLKPTYHLILGVPGKSNAFAISKKLGLPDEILARAESLIDSNDVKIEDVLKEIYDTKKEIELEKAKIAKDADEISKLKEDLSKDHSAVLNKEKEIIENAKIEARDILLKAKDDATNIIRDMNNIVNSSSSTTIKDLNNLRNNLNDSLKSVNKFDKDNSVSGDLTPSDLPKGTKVIVTNLNQKGIIIGQVKNNKVQVQVGNTKLNIDISNLELDFSNPVKQSFAKTSSTSHLAQKNISNEINVIGLNVDEAVQIVDKYLDSCSLSSLESIRIVHGKGTGKLRQGIQRFLKTNSHVKSFRNGTFGEGEMGVTIVEIKK